MPFQVSPGVNVSEIDLTTIVPAVTSTFGATAGVFKWGPVEERVLISSEDELVSVFGKPNANNYESFFTAANFLAYGNQLYVTRAASEAKNAVAPNGLASDVLVANTTYLVKNLSDFNQQESSLSTSPINANVHFMAKYAGAAGNSLRVSLCPSANAYSGDLNPYNATTANTAASFSINIGQNVANVFFVHQTNQGHSSNAAIAFKANLNVGDKVLVGNSSTGTQYMTIASLGASSTDTTVNGNSGASTQFNIVFKETFKQRDNVALTSFTNTNSVSFGTRFWEFFNAVDRAPGTSNYVGSRNANSAKDEVHIVVVDEKGVFTGIPGEILEVWNNVSRATDAKSEQGGSIYYRNVLNDRSAYIWSTKDILESTTATAMTNTAISIVSNRSYNFELGADGEDESNIPVSKLATAYDLYKSAEDVDVSLILAGKSRGQSGETLPNYIIDNIVESRRDCVAFISPALEDVVNVPGRELNNVVEFRNLLRSTSYAVLDSGYKYQYDKYNDEYRWVPLNGDIAGLCVRTDNVRDPWWSPAGFNRGQIKNIVKLAYNPDKTDRDVLYRSGVNPVVNFPGQGTVLYGDKTLLARPSAFDRINVRRLFIVLEKAIATAAKSTLFEFNDDFTRASFRNLIEPYLRDVQGRRGIYDFRVVCDSTNNTPEVIDRNEFRGDIYIKPARSINFIQLNFVAVRTGVEFEEIVGKF